jgi:hypothetical protein
MDGSCGVCTGALSFGKGLMQGQSGCLRKIHVLANAEYGRALKKAFIHTVFRYSKRQRPEENERNDAHRTTHD